MLNKKFWAAVALLATAEPVVAATLVVAKSPACGCCNEWVKHMRASGFDVTVRDVSDVTPIARQLHVPERLRSCHIALIEGYAIEGHVPASDVRRLLKERPRAAGLAVAGMPMGSPGMDHGGRKEPYKTIMFDRSGKSRVYAAHK
jgi:hypothetical protein